MIRKRILVLPAILLSLAMLSACGDNPTPQVVVVTATPAPTTPTAAAATPAAGPDFAGTVTAQAGQLATLYSGMNVKRSYRLI